MVSDPAPQQADGPIQSGITVEPCAPCAERLVRGYPGHVPCARGHRLPELYVQGAVQAIPGPRGHPPVAAAHLQQRLSIHGPTGEAVAHGPRTTAWGLPNHLQRPGPPKTVQVMPFGAFAVALDGLAAILHLRREDASLGIGEGRDHLSPSPPTLCWQAIRLWRWGRVDRLGALEAKNAELRRQRSAVPAERSVSVAVSAQPCSWPSCRRWDTSTDARSPHWPAHLLPSWMRTLPRARLAIGSAGRPRP